MASASTRTAVEPPQPRPSSSSAVLQPYVLQPPSWRAPLLATSNPAPPQSVAYPELFPGATALFPQQAASSGLGGGSGVTYAGIGRDSSAALGIVSASGAKEDDLNEQVVKTGFLNKPVVQVRPARLVGQAVRRGHDRQRQSVSLQRLMHVCVPSLIVRFFARTCHPPCPIDDCIPSTSCGPVAIPPYLTDRSILRSSTHPQQALQWTLYTCIVPHPSEGHTEEREGHPVRARVSRARRSSMTICPFGAR